MFNYEENIKEDIVIIKIYYQIIGVFWLIMINYIHIGHGEFIEMYKYD